MCSFISIPLEERAAGGEQGLSAWPRTRQNERCVCMCVRGRRSLPIRPCFFIFVPQSDWRLLASQLLTEKNRKRLLSPDSPGIPGSPLAAFRGGFLDKRLAPFKIEETSLKSLRFFFFFFSTRECAIEFCIPVHPLS